VYFKNDLVLSTGGGGFGGSGFGRGGGAWQNTTPMARRPTLSDYENPEETAGLPGSAGGGGRGGFGRGRGGFGGGSSDNARVIMRFPRDADQILLSGTIRGGEALAGRAQVIDAPVGDGHVVMFSIRPFWRWQTQGTFFLGFNAILNWNDLDAGRDNDDDEPVTSPGNDR